MANDKRIICSGRAKGKSKQRGISIKLSRVPVVSPEEARETLEKKSAKNKIKATSPDIIRFPNSSIMSPEEFKANCESIKFEHTDMPLIHYNIIVDSDIIGCVIRELIGSGYHNIEIKKHDSNSHKVFFTLR